ILAEAGQDDEALKASARAVELRPRSAWVLASRGNVCNNLGHYEEGLEAFDKALGINDRRSWFHAGRGAALLGLEKADDAVAAYRRAVELRPCANSYAGLARALQQA